MSSRPLTASIANLATPGGFHDGDWVESKDQDPLGDIRLLQLADVGDGDFRDRSSRWINDEAFARLGCSWVLPGDVLVARMPDPIGRACVVPDDIGRAITVVDVAVLRCDPERAYNRYVMYTINEDSTRQGFELIQDGATRQRIPRKRLGRAQVPLPQLDEQRAIAEFLDEQTLRINTLIGKQQEMITLLRERRTSAVAALMDTAGHPVVPLRRVAEVTDCAHVTADFVDDGDTRYPVASIGQCQGPVVDLSSCHYTTRHFFDHLRAGGRAPKAGDLVFIRNVSVGLVSEVTRNLPTFAVGQETVLIRPLEVMSGRYLWLALTSSLARHAIEEAMIGSTFRRINVSAIRSLPVPLAERDEQDRIVDRLGIQTSKIDALIAKTEAHIALAKERRAALITAAVTGQIDVRTAGRATGAVS